MKTTIKAVFLSFLFGSTAQAQDSLTVSYPKWSLEMGISETKNKGIEGVIGLENKVYSVIHPYSFISADYNFRVRKANRTYAGIEFGFHNNQLVDQAFQFNLTIGGNYKVWRPFYVGWEFGLGFQQARRADLVYRFNGTSWESEIYPGKFQYNRQFIRGQVEYGYRLKKIPIDVFGFQNITVVRHWFGKDIPLGLLYSIGGIGVRYHLK
jgi:hypothetical protein